MPQPTIMTLIGGSSSLVAGATTVCRAQTTGRVLPGNKRNGDREKGARNRLSEQFLQAIADDFELHGVEAIECVRLNRPHDYLKVVASLLPSKAELDINVNRNLFAEVND